jgi:hypothetical protein
MARRNASISKSNVKRKLTPDEVKRVEAEAESVAAMQRVSKS